MPSALARNQCPLSFLSYLITTVIRRNDLQNKNVVLIINIKCGIEDSVIKHD